VFLFQIMAHLDTCWQENPEDPLVDDEYDAILRLTPVVAPLAAAIGHDTLAAFLDELGVTHGDRYPTTLGRLRRDLGVAGEDPEFPAFDAPPRRLHYRDRAVEPERSAGRAAPGIFPGRSSYLGRTVRLRVKKSKHGPESRVKPALGRP